jgi:hypothetical protein
MKYLLFLSLFLLGGNLLQAREFRVNQIPNGSKNQCLNCHFSMNGGSLNSFGQEIFSNHLTSKNSQGSVKWSSTLAALDSDGDTFSNGVELLDPTGVWKTGQSNPGNPADVSNPGNKSIVPTSVKDLFTKNNDGNLKIESIYPNPVKESFNLSVKIEKQSNIKIEILDLLGNSIAVVSNQFFNEGNYSLLVNPSQIAKMSLMEGNYFLLISSSNSYDLQSFKIVK